MNVRTIKADAETLKRNIEVVGLIADRKTYNYRQIVGLALNRHNIRSNRTVSKALSWGMRRGILESSQRGVYVMTMKGSSILSRERAHLKKMTDRGERGTLRVTVPDRQKDCETFVYGTMSAAVAFEGTEPSLREVFGGAKLVELETATREYINKVNKIAPQGIQQVRLRIEGARTTKEVSPAAKLRRII